MKLYEISNSLLEVRNMMEEGEVDLEVIESTLQSLELAFEDKVSGIASIIKSLKVESVVIAAEEFRLAARKKAVDKQHDWWKQFLENEMQRVGKEKVKTPIFTVYLQLNNPSVEVVDPDKIPADYWIQPEPQQPQLDKRKIIDEWKDKKMIDGVRLVRKKGVRIR